MKDVTQSSVCAQCHQEVDVAINLSMALEGGKKNASAISGRQKRFFITDT